MIASGGQFYRSLGMEAIPHCLKMKMNGQKRSKFQYHFTGLLGTSLMLKQETEKSWTLEIIPFICLNKQIDRTKRSIFFLLKCLFFYSYQTLLLWDMAREIV